jgi:FkbM family methyltransferase
VRKCIRGAGWEVKRIGPCGSEATQLVRQLRVHQVGVVFDVGANIGQFAEKLRDAGFPGRIVSFEPATAAHSRLSKRAGCHANWIVAPRMALGDCDGTITLNLAGNSASSSVLPMLPSHVSADPKSRYIGSEPVDLRTLDSVGNQLTSEADRIFLKLDVQGFEFKVLQGAEQFLSRVAGIQIELSLVPLYEGEHLFQPMLHEMKERGYDMWSLIPGFVDPDTGRLLQLDAIFFRKEPGSGEDLRTKPESATINH